MADGPRLPGVIDDADDEDRIVLHVDADCFYAACERLRESALRGEPLVVGMGYEPGDSTGAVATASYEAREFGVESAMAIGEALDRLPRRVDAEDDPEIPLEESGYYRPVDMDYYESVSAEVREILHDCADVVREVSVDEAYLDVSERTGWDVADGFARHVKDRVRREVGVTVSVGVAPTMSAAKIASDYDKPDGLTVVRPGEVRDFLAPLDVADLHGVGPVTARELREMGLETAEDVAAADPDPLTERFGERGRELYDRARGVDDRRVTPKGLPKSFSRESAFGDPVVDWDRKRESLETLAEAVADRARREGALYRTVGVKAVTPPYDVNTRERSLPGPVDEPELVREIAIDLFEEFDDERVRKLGVRVANLEFAAGDQASLEGWEDESADGEANRSTAGTDAGDGEGSVAAFAERSAQAESAPNESSDESLMHEPWFEETAVAESPSDETAVAESPSNETAVTGSSSKATASTERDESEAGNGELAPTLASFEDVEPVDADSERSRPRIGQTRLSDFT